MRDRKDAAEKVAFVALGSNIAPRVRYMIRALHELHVSEGIRVLETSAVYASPAHTVGDREEPDYLNAVAKIVTTLTPRAVMDRCLDVERALGRERTAGKKWQRRTIDIDIVFYGDERVSATGLSIPHPRLSERLFVLVPLRDLIGPTAVLPGMSDSVDVLIRDCPDRAFPVKTILSLRNYA